jgi:hypothetical protein
MTARIYVLEVPENKDIVKVAAQDPSVTVDKVGPYFRVTAEDEMVIDRRSTGCRQAVWYSAIAGIENSIITQFDKDALRVRSR